MIKKITGFFVYCLLFSLILGNFLVEGQVEAKTETTKELLVKFKGEDEFKVIEVFEGDFANTLEKYKVRSDVSFVEPNFSYKISITPTDTYYDKQWYLEKIKADKAWDIVSEAPEIVIAIIDSGVQLRHPELGPNIWENQDEIPNNGKDDDNNGFIDDFNGWDFVANTFDPVPKFEEGFTEEGVTHGTIVAGIVAASGNNNSGIAGVSWSSKIMPLRALDGKGEGKVSEVVKAIDYAINNGADIINFSFVGFDYSQALQEAITRAYKAGIIMVAAAGNEQGEGNGYNLSNIPMYPACNDGEYGENMVIGVAATDTLDQKASFSSYGFKCVDITAPGVSIYSTVPYMPNENLGSKVFNKYFDGFYSGTSMAAPMVVGALALIEGVNKEANTKEIKEILLESADNISRLNPDYLGQLGSGRLNVYEAVYQAKARMGNFYTDILLAPESNHTSQIKRSNLVGDKKVSFSGYASNFLGGSNVASGDVDGDGEEEIIVGAGNGGGPHIRIFDKKGNLQAQFFAFNENFRGGVQVAAGDIDGDGKDEILAGAGFGGGPQVRIFNNSGKVLGQFFAYDKNFRGGVNVAAGDVNGDGKDEIVTGAGFGGGPQVRIFNNHGNSLGQFFAYDKNFRGGVNIAVADVDGGAARKKAEIITAPGKTGGPHIRIFNEKGDVKSQFFAYNENFRGGVNVAAGDIDGDSMAEIVTGAGPGGSPHVRVFETDGKLIGSFYSYENDFTGGVKVGVIKIKK